jgi:hypothetical protein
MRDLREARHRHGAYGWSLVRSTEDPSSFTEVWFETSWTEHLRHHERVSADDRKIQTDVRALPKPGTEPEVSHYVAMES